MCRREPGTKAGESEKVKNDAICRKSEPYKLPIVVLESRLEIEHMKR